MAPLPEESRLKRALPASIGEDESEIAKKPRRSTRLKEKQDTPLKGNALPSPLTHQESTATEAIAQSGTVTPPSQIQPRSQMLSPPSLGFSPGNNDTQTQPFSQFIYPPTAFSYEVQDEEAENVWGYLVPLDAVSGETLVLRKRTACPMPKYKKTGGRPDGKRRVSKETYENQELEYEKEKIEQSPSSGYLIGRHPECDRIIDAPTVSNRHCLLFSEARGGDNVGILEDLSANGTFVNDAIVGRNKRRELRDCDEIAILDEARFIFRYPRSRASNRFGEKYSIQEQLGKGHFASVYLCIEKSSGMRYAVKKFEKRHCPGDKSRIEGLQQEIAVLMSVSHPSLLCLKDTFEEDDGVYLVLELAPEGELFNWIVMKQKLSEDESRQVFVQLFQAVKYLQERNVVHRDIKPENVLLLDKNLTVKLADFGLAKIIGEESFTTTLCGTPSYVAPEILQNSNHRRYTRAVDIWSLGVVLYICLCGFPPFSDELYSPENPYTLAEQILMGRFDYPSPYWDSVGDPALDLIDRMLTVDPEKRITVDGCLDHPWTTGHAMPETQVSIDSTEGLTGAMGALDFSKRKPQRERTLLSTLNEVHVSRVIEQKDDGVSATHAHPPIKIFDKNHGGGSITGSQSQPLGNGLGGETMAFDIGTEEAINRENLERESLEKLSNENAKGKAGKKGAAAKKGGKKATPKVGKEPAPDADRTPADFMALGGKGDQQLFDD